jgi:hypothetical protein
MNGETIKYTPIELNKMPETREKTRNNFQLENFYKAPIEIQYRTAQAAINFMDSI